MRASPAARAAYAAATGIEADSAAGLRYVTRPRGFESVVGIYNARAAGLDPDGWATVCETHDSIVIHDSYALAVEHAAFPVWCDECQEHAIEKGAQR